jgi:hypothetical protein
VVSVISCRDNRSHANAAVITLHEIALLRLAAQRIAGPGLATATETVRWLSASQAQDRNGVLTSVALHTASGTREGEQSCSMACVATRGESFCSPGSTSSCSATSTGAPRYAPSSLTASFPAATACSDRL